MRTYVFQGLVTALTSLSHNGGDSHGVNSLFRREKFVVPREDGHEVEEIPVISGNGIRGVLRDVGMSHMCRALGIQLNLQAFHFLFSGGSLSSDGGKAVDVDEARRVRELIPLTGVLGGALGNSILPGKVDVGKMIPVCTETAHLMPEKFVTVTGEDGAPQPRKLLPFSAFLQEEMYTRKDDAKDDHKQDLILPAGLKLLDASRIAKKGKQGTPQDDTGQHQQMRYYVETLAAGTPLFWQITLRDVSDLEFEAFATMMAEWLKRPVIGGKANVGLGQVKVEFSNWSVIDSACVRPVDVVGMPLGELYARHLADNKQRIIDLLSGMAKAAAA